MNKLIVLNLGKGNLNEGFPRVTTQLRSQEGVVAQFNGQLPPAPFLAELYCRWQSVYSHLNSRLGHLSRIKFKQDVTVTNVSALELRNLSKQLADQINAWLNSTDFYPIDRLLRTQLSPFDSIRVIIETNNHVLWRLPWHLWDFFKDYPNAEVALSLQEYEQVRTSNKSPVGKVRILAILGNSQGINVEQDYKIISQLTDVEIVTLVEPQRQELSDYLWEQYWDILFFAGHSNTEQESGRIYINSTDSLTINELRYSLSRAVERGLKLAIFNSCDGLGLARDLADLAIPQIIVMRESVPDWIAQEFLKYFLNAFAEGQSLYQAVRTSRQRLESWENQYPGASWMPVICQNPAQLPQMWKEWKDSRAKNNCGNGKSGWFGQHRLIKSIKPGSVLLLLIGVLSSRFTLSWSANWYGVKSQLAGQLPTAQRLFSLAEQLDPTSPVVHYNQAVSYEEQQNYQRARKEYQKAIEGGVITAYNNQARLYILEEKNEAAISLLDVGLPLAENKNQLYTMLKNRGWARLKQGRYAEAEVDLQKAIQLNSDRAAAYCLMAQVLEKQEENASSLTNWEACLGYASHDNPDEDTWIGMAKKRLKVARGKQ